jgi:probable phosphoglycerate mutase
MKLWANNRLPGGRVRNGGIVYLVRHGETSFNAEDRIQGACDVPLNETGEQQALEIGARLAAEISNRHIAVFCSALNRTRQTLHLVLRQLEMPLRYETDERLNEVNHGVWNGKTKAELPREGLAACTANRWHFAPEGGESQWEAAKRVRSFLTKLRGSALLVCHNGSGRLIRGYLQGWTPDYAIDQQCAQNAFYRIENGNEALIGAPKFGSYLPCLTDTARYALD